MLAYISRAASSFATSKSRFSGYFSARCDEAQSLDEIEENLKTEEEEKGKIKGAGLYENIENSCGVTAGATFDGFRVIVQKQVNLNTVVSHFYWVGSQQVGQLYQYRLILPFDDKTINVATDMDMNIEGEVSANLSDNLSLSSNFGLGQSNKVILNCDMKDSVSATRLSYNSGEAAPSYSLSYSQAMTKSLQMGGRGIYSNGALNMAFGGMYDSEENVFGAIYGSSAHLFKAYYMRRVNPNRVHLSTDISVDQEGNPAVTVGAEYTLKQSKIGFTIDSSAMIKSTLESTLSPGVQFQLSAEMMQAKDHYRFGYGLIMG